MKRIPNRAHLKWVLTRRQRANVKTLLKYLESGRLLAGFDMEQFNPTNSMFSTDCGSAVCIIGHGPHAGIKKFMGELWSDYADDRFGAHSTECSWQFMFSSLWKQVDNSVEGATKRVAYALKYGIPQTSGMDENLTMCYMENIKRQLNEQTGG